jgi:hypothetical protein
MITGASAGHVKQVALAVVNLFKIGIVGDILDALLGGNDRMISSSHAMTATARNSKLFARCIVPIETLPSR